MKAKKIFGTLTAKFAALALICGLAGGVWAVDPVTIQGANGSDISVYEVSSGFYQSGTTYGNSTDFYITNLNGLKFFRDIVNGETAASYAYFTATGVTGTYPTTPAGIKSFHSNNMFSGKTVHLCEDIDLAGEQWVSIGFNRAERTITNPDTSASASVSKCTFYGLFDAGIYDGEGNLTGTHVISNLDTSWQYVPEAATLQEKYQLTGLFGQLSGGTTAGVKNLTVRNATVVGRTDVGVIAGRSYNGGAKIENCHVVGTVNVSGTGTYIGGLVGECRASIVNSSLDAAAGSSISGLAYVGGLAGSVFQYNANDSVEVSGSAVSNTAVSASYSGVAGVGALVGVTNPSGTYHGNVVISGNEANNVPVSAPNSSASKGGVGTLVGNALYDDGAYAIVADNTVSGTTSATAGGDAVTSKMGAANDNIAVGANVTFDESGKVTGGIFEVINEEVIATGYITDNNPDTETSTSYPLTIGGPYVALIGTTPYSTLADAVAAVPENGAEATTITMFADTELSATVMIPANKNIVLDLNGKTVTVPDATPHIYAIRNNGTMTLTDSAGSGSIAARGVYNGPDNTSAKMTVEGGTYYNLDTDGGAAIFNKAELTVNGGTFTGKVCLNNSGSAATMVVNDATANGTSTYAVQNNGGTVTINDITVNGKFGAFGQWQDTSATTINGGAFAIVDNTYAGYTHHCVYVGAGDLTINGGTFTNGDNQADSGLALCMLSSGTATITGGTFTNLAPDAGNETISLWGGSGTFAVSDGNYNRQVKAEYCVDGYSPVTTPNAQGMYTVESDYEAQIVRNGVVVTPKGSLTAMISAAQVGDTVQLLKDLNVASVVLVGKSITIDGANHKITTSTASRVIRVTTSNIDVTFKDLEILSTCGTPGNDGDYRGISIDSPMSNLKVTLDNVKLTAPAYAFNVVGGSNLAFVFKDSEIKGWAAINSFASDSTFAITNSTLHGYNDKSLSEWHNFATISLDGNTGAGCNNTVTIHDTQIVSESPTGNREWWVYPHNGSVNNAIIVSGNSSFVNANDEDDILNFYFADTDLTSFITVPASMLAGIEDVDDKLRAKRTSRADNSDGTFTIKKFEPVAMIGSLFYESFDVAIAVADVAVAAGGEDPAIMVLNSSAPLTNPDWKISSNGYLVRKVYVAQIVTDAGATTNKYETVEDALMAAQTAGATIEVLANSTETPAHALEVLMGGDITLTSSVPVRVEIAPTAKTSSVDTDGMAYIRSASADARCTFTVGANVTLAFPATAAGAGAMYIGYSSANAADMVINGRLELYEPYVGSLSTLTVNPSGSIKSISECLIVRWGAAVNVIGTGATWSDENPQAEFSYVELQGGVTTLKDTYAKGGAWVHIYDRNNKAPDYETKLVLDNSVLATSKINNLMAIEMDCDSQIVTPEVVNTGAINIDATGITQATKVIDYTGSGAMALADYGTVNVIDGMVYVDANDLWVKKLPVAQVISANGTTTNKYDTLSAALEAATNGTTVELLSDVDEDINPIPALQNVTLDFCGHTVTGQLKGAYNKKINGFVVKNGSIVGRNSSRWANLQIASGSKNVVVTNMTLTTVRPNVSTAGYAFYNQSGSSIPLQDVVADGRFYVGNSGSIIAIESGTYRNTVGAAHAIENNGVVAARGGTFYYDPTTPNNIVAQGYVATETNDVNDVQCWVIELGPAFAIVTYADSTVAEFWDLDEAISALAEGATLTIKPGTYNLANANYTLPKNVTIIGVEENGSRVLIKSKPTFNSANGLTIENIDFDGGYSWTPPAVTVHGDATFKDCTITGQNAVYYSTVNGTLTFDGCTLDADVYALNVGEGTGDVIVKDCTISGWTSFGNVGKTIITGTTFADGDYDYVRFYQDVIISNCTFNSEMLININETDKKLIVIDSACEGGASVASIIGEGEDDDPIVNNHVAVGTGVRLNEDGEIVGGLFETVDDELIAEQYGTGANSDSETSATYPTAVGLIEVLELEEQPGATATEATYKVSVVVVDADGHAIGTVSTEQTVVVRIGDADVANATLAKFDVDKIIAAAFATAGDDSTSITTIELLVKKTAGEAGAESVAYEVHPEAIVTIEKPGEAAAMKTIALTDAALATNASFSFDLDVSALSGVAVGDWVKVTHRSANHADEESLYKAKAGGSGKVVTVTTTHFSTFTATSGDPAGADASLLPSVTNKVVSANLFGALTVNAGTATNAFVAVPFGAFDIGDVKIAAADIVQAATLSAGDKMYVWNGAEGTSQKYEVYKVDANGAWAVEEHKVTVAADGTVTEGSESPESLKVPTGTGIFIERKDTSKPIYVYGQVLTNSTASTTFGSGLTLVSAPSTKAMAQIDLNALTWSGVGDVTVSTTTSGKKIVTSYTNADFIYYRNAANKVIRFYHYNGKWGTVSGTWKDAEAVIPAGTAFWYMNHGSASVAW